MYCSVLTISAKICREQAGGGRGRLEGPYGHRLVTGR